MRSQSTEARRSRLRAWLGGADDAGATRDVVTDYQDTLLQVEMLLAPPQQDDGPGTLEVGANERHEVVVNLPRDMTGHIVFNPDQARHLAVILVRQATAAEQAAAGVAGTVRTYGVGQPPSPADACVCTHSRGQHHDDAMGTRCTVPGCTCREHRAVVAVSPGLHWFGDCPHHASGIPLAGQHADVSCVWCRERLQMMSPPVTVCPACAVGNGPPVRVRLCETHAAMAGAKLDLTNHHNALACPYCNPHQFRLRPRTRLQVPPDRPPMDMDAARKAMGLPDLVPLGNGLQRVGGHIYDEHGTSDCANGCGCWAGPSRSGGPDGVDPFGACPNAGDGKKGR